MTTWKFVSRIKQKLLCLVKGKSVKGIKKGRQYLPKEIFSDDIFLVSYPRSGSTWLNFLLANYLTKNECDLISLREIIPDIHFNPEQCEVVKRPRFIKSHAPFVSEYKKIVYLVRDGRDVAVSYYFYMIKFGEIIKNTRFDDYLTLFNEGLLPFGSWSEHIHQWLDTSAGNLALVRYEDIKEDPARQLTRMLNFSALSIDQKDVLNAVEASRFKRMKKLDEIQSYRHDKSPNVDPSIPFIRNGKVGGYRSYFSDKALKEFIHAHGAALERLNYL